MKYPARVQEIINVIVGKNRALAEGDDDARRKLNRLIAEQIAFELGPQWGTKSADPNRPQSKDSIAFQDGDKLWGWDTINGSTRQPNQFPDAEDITGQHFIAVNPTNYLGSAPPIPEPPKPQPEPTPTPVVECKVDLAPLTAISQQNAATLDALRNSVEVIFQQLKSVQAELDDVRSRQDRAFTGKILGYSITLDVRK